MTDSPSLSGLTVADLMSPNVICVSEDDTVAFVVKVFDRCHISGAPVVNATGEYVGVLSKTDLFARDLLEFLRDGGSLECLTVHAIMNPCQPIMVNEEMSVEKAADLMLRNKIHRVFVKNRLNRISGVVSSYDILKVVASESPLNVRSLMVSLDDPNPKTARIEYLKGQLRKEKIKQSRS